LFSKHFISHEIRKFARIVSKNNTKTCWVLKGDIKKFFASIDQHILVKILEQYIPDNKIVNLLKGIIFSFYSTEPGVGLPLGNLTSQLFANVYMNELDQFMKHKLKTKYYIRYSDDFVVLSENRSYLEDKIPIIQYFLQNKLKLKIHPDKIFIKTFSSGIDFLGWINFPDYRIIRNTTKNRILKKISGVCDPRTLSSYFGILRNGNTEKIKSKVANLYIRNYSKDR
jgi:RNA-directed DNA polymerase